MYVSGSFVVSFPKSVDVLMLWRVGEDGEGGIARSIEGGGDGDDGDGDDGDGDGA
jgi:hypothetical protein